MHNQAPNDTGCWWMKNCNGIAVDGHYIKFFFSWPNLGVMSPHFSLFFLIKLQATRLFVVNALMQLCRLLVQSCCYHADDSAGCGFRVSVCLYVYRTISQKPTITKLDVETFCHESWKTIYFWVKRLKFKATSHKNTAGMGHSSLVNAGFL